MKQEKIYLKDYKAPTFKVNSLHLDFNILEDHTIVKATSQIECLEPHAVLELDGEELKLISVCIDGRALSHEEYRIDGHFLRIPVVPHRFSLEVVTELHPDQNKALEGLYASSGCYVTQCEAQGFRRITYFFDRPDVMTSYFVTIEADKKKYPVLLSNGDRKGIEDLGNGRHRATWQDPHKKPCYLFALFAGDLGVIRDTFTTQSGRVVNLEVYAAHGKQSRCHHAMESLKKAMKWDEDRFGREYDLNDYMIVAIDDFNAGAMENKGLNIFNSRLVLADKESATDLDFFNIESVVAHEYFHNWTGNRVTLRDWFQLSLKEGLTVFRDQEFSADVTDRGLQRINDVDGLRTLQFAEDAGPNAHPVRPESCMAVDNFFTTTIYEKGSEVIRMMQTLVGRKGFRKGMDLYFERHDGQAVTTEDFAAAIADANQIDFSQFKLWYSQAGTPRVQVLEKYDSQKQIYELSLQQSCPATPGQSHKKPFHIPLLIGLLDGQGHELSLNSPQVRKNSDGQSLIELKNEKETFVFSGVLERPVLSLNREFSAPIHLAWEAREEDLFFLMARDSDSFNQREAAQILSTRVLKDLYQAARNKETMKVSSAYLEAMGVVLDNKNLDPAFKAKMLSLPAYSQLAQSLEVLNAEALKIAYEELNRALASRFEKQLLHIYNTHQMPNLKDRELKNKALSYLAFAQESYLDLAWNQFQQADNMTDRLVALELLTDSNHPQRNAALSAFYERWKGDSVVINKWFSAQANIKGHSNLGTVQNLMRDPAFNISNPNNVYSLNFRFAQNISQFYSSQHPAFEWYADTVIKLDKLNPQVAARLASAFKFTGKLEPETKEMALKAVRRILAEPSLSKNSKELLVGLLEK